MLDPIEITVDVAMNGEQITPLMLGNITYEYPSILVTDKITEIVSADYPINYSRMAALFGGVSKNISTNTSSSRGGGRTDILDPMYETSFGNSSSTTVSRTLGYAHESDILHTWNSEEGIAHFPIVDFFPRYNQWFANVSWPYPFSPIEARTPEYYKILFTYVDRAAKKVYWREGRVFFRFKEWSKGLPVIKPVITSPKTVDLELSILKPAIPFGFNPIFFPGGESSDGSPVYVWQKLFGYDITTDSRQDPPDSTAASNLPPGLTFENGRVSGYVVHPSPGTKVTFPAMQVSATNNIGATTQTVAFNIIDKSDAAPTIQNTNLSFDVDRIAPSTTIPVGTHGPQFTNFQLNAQAATGCYITSFTATASWVSTFQTPPWAAGKYVVAQFHGSRIEIDINNSSVAATILNSYQRIIKVTFPSFTRVGNMTAAPYETPLSELNVVVPLVANVRLTATDNVGRSIDKVIAVTMNLLFFRPRESAPSL